MADSDCITAIIAAGLARYRPLVDDWDAFVAALAQPLPTCVWTNTSRVGTDRATALLQDADLDPTPLAWRPDAYRLNGSAADRWWYTAGLFHLQEEASMLPVHLLNPRPGDRVLDLCAAPGGKTAQIALAVGDLGTVVANDPSASRLRALRGTLDRLRSTNVTVTQQDGGNFPRDAGPFDRILVDAPCSGEGTQRRNARKKPWSSKKRSLGLIGKQTALLRKAARLCRPGGRIVYSTCTFSPEENEGVVSCVIEHYPDFDLRVLPVTVPGLATAPGVTRWDGAEYRSDLQHAIRLWPHRTDSGGFFVAVLEKHGGAGDGVGECWDLKPSAAEDWREAVDRFGIDAAVWDAFVVHRKSKAGLHIVARGHRPPVVPEPASVGLRFINDRGEHAKLTTAAAMAFAGDATRNVVDLDSEGAVRFLARADQPLTEAETGSCDSTGYVIVRHAGVGLGIGIYLQDRSVLLSRFPKRWSC